MRFARARISRCTTPFGKKLTDLGDIIGVKGYVFRTKMGEISIHVKELKLLTKALRPVAGGEKKDADGNVHDAFTDPEQRYRMRYVDLIVNPEVRDVFRKRAGVGQHDAEDYLSGKRIFGSGNADSATLVRRGCRSSLQNASQYSRYDFVSADLQTSCSETAYCRRL